MSCQYSDLVFAQIFLGWPLGKHCKLLEGNIWRKVVSTFENDFRERSTLFLSHFYHKWM